MEIISPVGQRIVGADGVVYEIVVDPKTGKKFKKWVQAKRYIT